MLKRTTNPSIIFNETTEEIVTCKVKELNIEVISRHVRDGKVSLHIYGTIESVELLLTWAEKDFTQEMEAEF